MGSYRDGVGQPRIEVVLATSIPEETCRAIDPGCLDPAGIDPTDCAGGEARGVLCVPRAGEVLHRLERDPF